MSKQLPAVAASKGRLTEREVRAFGATANRIVNLRGLIASQVGAGTITVQTKAGAIALSLPHVDVEACLALLAERDATFLTQFDIELETATALRA